MDMSESMSRYMGRSYSQLQTLRVQAARLGFSDDVKFFDAVLKQKRITDQEEERK